MSGPKFIVIKNIAAREKNKGRQVVENIFKKKTLERL